MERCINIWEVDLSFSCTFGCQDRGSCAHFVTRILQERMHFWREPVRKRRIVQDKFDENEEKTRFSPKLPLKFAQRHLLECNSRINSRVGRFFADGSTKGLFTSTSKSRCTQMPSPRWFSQTFSQSPILPLLLPCGKASLFLHSKHIFSVKHSVPLREKDCPSLQVVLKLGS